MDVRHPDIEDFVDVKTDLNKVNYANISVRVNDNFMKAVINDTDYLLTWPCCDYPLIKQTVVYGDGNAGTIALDIDIDRLSYNELVQFKNRDDSFLYVKKIKAKQLFEKIAKNNWNYAEPGILYWDRISEYNMLQGTDFKYAGVNPCAEEPLPAGGSCLLGSINLAEFVKNPFTEKAEINYTELISTVHNAVRALNNVLQEGKFLHPLEEQTEAVSKWKQIGLGTMGLADMLIKLGVKYGDIDSLMFIHNVYKTIAEAAIIESANMAEETKFPYEGFDFEAFKKSDFINNLSLPKYVLSKIKRYGMYNSQLLTCAPTGSIATMLGVSTGIEPIYAMKYTRTTKSLEGKDNIFEIYTPIAKNYLKTHNNLPDYFIESKDISPSDRIRAQAQIQDFIDASISSTINLPKEATVEDIYNIYINAWRCNTKGVTVYRNGCAREGILNTEKIVKEVSNRQAPKRPKSIPAKVEVVKIKGELFAVFIGFYENKPYEIFTSKVDEHFTPEEGIIIKKSKGLYAFESANYRDIALMQTSSFEEKAATLYTSMLLRHGVNIKYIIKTAKKVNNNITSFSSAMCRVLIKYQPKDDIKELCPNCGAELIKEGGCTHCSTCEWSKCMFVYNLKNKRDDKSIDEGIYECTQ